MRFVALEANLGGESWERARFLELVEPADQVLVGTNEKALMAREARLDQRLNYQPYYFKGRSKDKDKGRGKGKDGGKGREWGNPFAGQEAKKGGGKGKERK